MTAALVLADERHVGLLAELVANRIRARPALRVLLPTGDTPRAMYRALRAHAAEGSLPAGHVAALGLDEYVGLPCDLEQDGHAGHRPLERHLLGLRQPGGVRIAGQHDGPNRLLRAQPGRAAQPRPRVRRATC
jgi:hypothetical protein